MIDDGILDGDYIIIQKNKIANKGDTVVAIINNEVTLKRYFIGSNGILIKFEFYLLNLKIIT